MESKIEQLFEGCHSNQDTPLMGCVFDPLCRTCRNLVEPDDLFKPSTCAVYGELPKEIYLANQASCERYTPKK